MNKKIKNINKIVLIFIITIFLFIEISFYPAIAIETKTSIVNNQNEEGNNKNILETTILRYCIIFNEIKGGVRNVSEYGFLGTNFYFHLDSPFKVFEIFSLKTHIFNGHVEGLIKGFHGILDWGRSSHYGNVVILYGVARYFEGVQYKI